MSPRTGRPKVDNPKDVRFSIRLDHDVYGKLEKYCKQHGMRKSEVIRKAIEDLILSEG